MQLTAIEMELDLFIMISSFMPIMPEQSWIEIGVKKMPARAVGKIDSAEESEISIIHTEVHNRLFTSYDLYIVAS